MTAEDDLHYGPFRIDRKNRALYKKQSEILLEPIPFNIFEFFVENVGQRFSTEALLDKFWLDATVGPSSVTTAVYKIRRMLAGDRGLLEGKSKTGYRLKMYLGSRIGEDELEEAVASSTLSAQFYISQADLRKLRAPDPLAERRAGLRDNLVVGCAIE